MPDGKRKRRHSVNRAKRRWYAHHRAQRFTCRFGLFSTSQLWAGLLDPPKVGNHR